MNLNISLTDNIYTNWIALSETAKFKDNFLHFARQHIKI